MRKWMLLSLLMLVGLAGCAAPIPEGRPGQLLYVTTFDAFNEDWQQFEGQLSARIAGMGQDPALHITIDDIQAGAFTVLNQVFADFDLIVEATRMAGPADNGFGVLFRYQDTRNYYLFMISSDGYYQLSRRLDGVDQVLSDWALSSWIQQGDSVNTVRVIGQGNTFTFLINDQQVPLCLTLWNPLAPGECAPAAPEVATTQTSPSAAPTPIPWSSEAVTWQFVDTAVPPSLPPQGQIGLGARSFGESGVVIAFDNLFVCGPYAVPHVPFRCEEGLSDGSS